MKKVYKNFSYRVFPGFYESILYDSDKLYCFNNGELPEGFCWEFVDGGFQKYCKETCEQWVSNMADALENSRYADHDNPLGLKIGKYCGMKSPKEYNFTTDKIQFSVDVNLNRLKNTAGKLAVRNLTSTFLITGQTGTASGHSYPTMWFSSSGTTNTARTRATSLTL